MLEVYLVSFCSGLFPAGQLASHPSSTHRTNYVNLIQLCRLYLHLHLQSPVWNRRERNVLCRAFPCLLRRPINSLDTTRHDTSRTRFFRFRSHVPRACLRPSTTPLSSLSFPFLSSPRSGDHNHASLLPPTRHTTLDQLPVQLSSQVKISSVLSVCAPRGADGEKRQGDMHRSQAAS